jgi:hypothetical protein
MDDINLYREAKEQYEKLIPDRNDGLILISLYDKYKDGDFTEENIISAINKVFKDQGNDTNRTEYNRNNVIILRLQESFLWRNHSRKTYQFKKYGLDFCHNIEKRLIEKYNPAKIKRFFNDLYRSLTLNIEEQKSFQEWITDHFDVRMPELVSQIEILDQQVNDSVSDFKVCFTSGESNIINTLHEVETRLEIIKEQSLELKNAFQISYDIDELLSTILETNEQFDQLENIQRVQHFHDSCRNQLEQVSKRIEKIKPRLREFIYDFNKQDFDRKTNKFIKLLLDKSVVRKDAAVKKVCFPNIIPSFKVRSTTHSQIFTIIPSRHISRKESVAVTKRQVDPVRSRELMEKAIRWKEEKGRVKFWTDKVFNDLEEKNIVVFTPLFFTITDTDGLAIAVKTTHNVLRQCTKLKHKYNVSIEDRPIGHPQNKYIAVWQMTLQIR